ncbi:MAG: hypothetical protein NTX94_00810, partial [Caldiserica bacterium]|nr:hypothetical protein [Caldisericota bacterium]
MRKTTVLIAALIVVGAAAASFLVWHVSPEPLASTYFLMDTVLTVKTTGGDAAAINEHLHALASGVED